jgi:hypothetical protein
VLASLFCSTLALAGCGDDGSGMPGDGGTGGPDASMPSEGGTDGGSGSDGGLSSSMRYGKRSDVQTVADPQTNTIVLFGGDDGPIVNQIPRANFLGSTWVFEPGVGWTEVQTDTAPSPRSRYAVAYDPNEGRMLLFGGRFREADSGPYTLHNDLWAFDFESRTWTQLHDGSGTAPGGRYFAGAAYEADTDTFYVTGGGLNENALSPDPAQDLWAFDGESWTEKSVSGQMPSQGLFRAWDYDPSRKRLLAFGGQVGDFVSPGFDELHALDVTTGEWTLLDDGNGPEGRFNAMLEYDAERDRYVMFGGHTNPGVNNDVWAYDPTDGGGWTELHAGDSFTGGSLGCMGNSREIPKGYVDQDLDAPERRTTSGFEILGDKAWVFAGESGCSDHLDDTWSFDLAGSSWTELLEARSGESCARRGDDCQCLCL